MRDIHEILKDIVATLQKFCDDNTLSVQVQMDDDFYYYCDRGVVGISIFEDERGEYFMENMFANGLTYDCGMFLGSFFHEIGHHYTLDWLTKKENKKCDKLKENLDGAIKEDNFFYFNIFDEKIATDWAIDFLNEYPTEIEALATSLNALINEIEIEDTP